MMIGEQISPTHRLQIVVSPPINAVSNINIVHNYYIVPLRALHTVHVYIPTSPLSYLKLHLARCAQDWIRWCNIRV